MQAFWVLLGSLSAFALSIISAAILSRYLEKTEYGTYRQILYVYNTLLIVFTVGLPKTFSYFLPRFNLAQGKDIVSKITRVLFLTGLAFSICLFLLSGLIASLLKNPELATGLKLFSPIPMLLLPTMGIEGIFATYKKTVYIAIYNTITRFLMLMFIVLPVVILKGNYLYAIYGWSVASMISLCIALYFKGIPFKGIASVKAHLSYTEVLTYSMPLAIASIAGIVIRSADQFYISRYFGPEVFAEFANGFIGLPFVGMVTGATSMVLMPLFSKMIYDKSNVENLISLWRNALLKSAIIIYPLVIFFIFNAKNIVELLYSSTYHNSAIYFQIAMVLNFFNIIIFAPLLLAMGKTKFYSRLHIIIAVVAWGIGYLVVMVFNSPIAVAIFSVALSIITVLIFIKYISILLEVSPFTLFPVKIIAALITHALLSIAFINLIINQLLPPLANYVSLIVTFVGFIVILFCTAKYFSLDYSIVSRPIINVIRGRLSKSV
jgi:O-antigen/teichoic acid export membrane protein